MSEIAQPGLLALLKEWTDRYGALDDPNFENDLALFRASIDDKDALIERLQKELGEARSRLSAYDAMDEASLLFDVRCKTIEECAKLAALSATASENHGDAEGAFMAREIEMAIRSLDGGGK